VAAPGPTGNEVSGRERLEKSNQAEKKKPLYKEKTIWVGGQSVVGRKGKDGKWVEVKSCSVM
jgi:hypothetical protein